MILPDNLAGWRFSVAPMMEWKERQYISMNYGWACARGAHGRSTFLCFSFVRRASIFADKLRCDSRLPSRDPECAIVGEWTSVCTIPNLAKVGVESSKPFARSKIS